MLIALIFTVAGALVYALSNNGKVQELGRGAYWVGLFYLVAALAGVTIFGHAVS